MSEQSLSSPARSGSPADPASGAALDDPDIARARAGDDEAFDRLVRPLRRELHAHGYRMLGSAHDADDAVQDALIRAWRGFGRFEGRGSLRSWLYTVVTRTCLDLVGSRAKRALPADLGPSSAEAVLGDAPRTEVAWLGPYADAGLSEAATDPGARFEQREAVELAFVAALQHLPGNQRAALLLFDVLGFSAAEIATTMDTSVSSVNSALQRARAVVAARVATPDQQQTLRRLGDTRVTALVSGFSRALENGDVDALVALLTPDVTWSMPPLPHWYAGIDAVTDFATRVPLASCGAWSHVPCRANGQASVASYLWDEAEQTYRAWSINVLTLRGGRIAEINSFLGAGHFSDFGLQLTRQNFS
ncbi:MAG: sigma-70 family RNA polymerase sigma factor [Propionibacteriaceae bacterium]